MITLEEFDKIDMRVGTIIDASVNRKAKIPAYKLKVDLGEFGFKWSSAQITNLYDPEDLIGKQAIFVVNFPVIRISEVKSEVRILGALTSSGCVLLDLDRKVPNGSKIA